MKLNDNDIIFIKKEEHAVTGPLQQTTESEYRIKFGDFVDMIGRSLLNKGWNKLDLEKPTKDRKKRLLGRCSSAGLQCN